MSLVRTEAADQLDRAMLFAPLALGAGAGLYFALRFEPGVIPLVALAGAAIGAALWAKLSGRSRVIGFLLTLIALFAVGLAVAKLRSDAVATPVLEESAPRYIEAWVVDVAPRGTNGPRLILAPVRISRMAAADVPVRVRVTFPDGPMPVPGSAVRLTAILGPPPPPASPGAYDFARDAWFDAIGGVGFARQLPEPADLAPPPWRLRLMMQLNAARWRLGERIAAGVGPEAAGLAVAMTTGHEAHLEEDTEEALRTAGLAHIVSISGLHMTIVGGFVFLLARGILAAIPPVALRIDIKKVAALAGLAAVIGYLLISGAPAPAERAAITAAVAFAAVLFDRRAISLHSLALAAILILLVEPEAIVSPGFQMSFAATAALVALYEAWPRPIREINSPWWIRLIQGAAAWLGISLMASLVAGLATGPIALQSFNRMATWGLLANLLSEPLTTFVLMPTLALGAFLEVFGLGGPFLAVAGLAIRALQAMAAWFAGLPFADPLISSAPDFTLPIAFTGMLFVCLWKGRLRWLGLPFALAVTLWPRPPIPDVWIADDGSAAAVHSGAYAVLPRPDAKLFAADLWSRRRGLTLGASAAAWDCNRNRCFLSQTPLTPRLAGWWTRRAPKTEDLARLCAGADIVVMRAQVTAVPPTCSGVLVLREADFQRGGSAELHRTPGGWRITWANDLRGRRPWVRLAAPDGAE